MNDDEFIKLFYSSNSIGDIIFKLKLNICGAQYKNIKVKCNKLKLNTSHFDSSKYRLSAQNVIRQDMKSILVDNSKYKSMNCLKIRLISEKYLKYECSICSLTSWCETPISLQLDHINGIRNDNRIENLRLLCPNCHSQTDTYAGKNKSKMASAVGIEPTH